MVITGSMHLFRIFHIYTHFYLTTSDYDNVVLQIEAEAIFSLNPHLAENSKPGTRETHSSHVSGRGYCPSSLCHLLISNWDSSLYDWILFVNSFFVSVFQILKICHLKPEYEIGTVKQHLCFYDLEKRTVLNFRVRGSSEHGH